MPVTESSAANSIWKEGGQQHRARGLQNTLSHDRLQLSHIAGPMEISQHLHCFISHPLNIFAKVTISQAPEVIH